jgi:hypothetical protein
VAEILGASIKLVVDDARLRVQIDELKADAQKFGQEFIHAYQAGMAKAGTAGGPTWQRTFGKTTETFQGRYGDWLARTGMGMGGGPGGIAGGPGGPGAGPGGGGGFRGVGALGRAAGLAGAGRLGGFARLAASDPRLAIAAGATLAVTNYVNQIKQAAEAERELNRALQERDPEAVNAILVKRTTALKDLEDAAREAYQPVTSLETAVRAALGQFALSWEQLTGPGMANRRKQVEEATKAATEMWEAFGAPKLAIDALKRSATEMQANAEAAIKAAETTIAYSAAVDMLVKAKKENARASEEELDLELKEIEARRQAKKITDAQASAQAKNVELRRTGVRAQLGRDVRQIEQDRRRQFGEMEAAEIEHTAKMTSLAQERRDSIVQTLGQIVEIEAATTLSLEQAYRARAAIMQAGTQDALDTLKTQADAQRAALQARIEGAQGQERVRLERELTLVTEQENTKRAQIEQKYLTDRLRLYRQAQQEQIALQERVFAIQRMLGERTFQDDLDRQTSIARGAQAGSQTQIKALEQVASLTKALSDQAKEFLTSALAASDALDRKAGREPSKYVSFGGLGASLAEQTATRFAQLTEAERTAQAGGMISREDTEALMRGELDKLRTQREAGLKRLAQNVGRFGGGIPTGDLSRAAFGEQIAGAFEKPIDTFTSQVGPQFASMVDKAKPEFLEMTELWATAIDTMVKKTEDGTSKMERAMFQNFKAWLARDLDREVKTF